MRFQRIPIHPSQYANPAKKWQPPHHRSIPTENVQPHLLHPDSFNPHKPHIKPQLHLRPNLPFPSTQQLRFSRPHHLLTFWQRVFSLLIAIFVAVSLLGCLVTLLGQRLEQVAATSITSDNHIQPQVPLVQNASTSHHVTRRLASLPEAEHSALATHSTTSARTARGPFSPMYHSISVVLRLLKAFYGTGKAAITLCIIPNGGIVVKLNPSTFSLKPLLRNNAWSERQESTHRKMSDIYQDLLMGKVHSPLQVPPQDVQAPAPPLSTSEGIFQGNLPTTHERLKNPTADHLWQKITRAKEQQSAVYTSPRRDVVHPNALSVIGKIEIAATPARDSSLLVSNAQPSELGNNALTGTTSHTIPQQNPCSPIAQSLPYIGQNPQAVSTPVSDGIQTWEVERGRFLCRIQNIGRLSDGSIVLPKWMRAHADFLQARCGLKGAIFAVENAGFQGGFSVEEKLVLQKKKTTFELDSSNKNRDLFGSTAPRNHMPHFVSDILLPLVASETLMGPPKGHIVSSSMHWSTGFHIEQKSCRMTEHLKPAMLVFEETLNRPSGEWVPRLAHFFEHPNLGFKLISAGMERPTKNDKKKKLVLAVYRSLITTNFNMHDPFGLFGPQGRNLVLSINGVTRDPAWTMTGMRQKPCRVKVTVLTRKGPRALLKLKDLEKRVKAGALQESLSIDFQIVDFGSMPFDEQVRTMQDTNVLVATHGAGNANLLFMRPGAAVIEVFPFSYKAGPFDNFARIFGLAYNSAMSAPQTDVFKECMNRHETNDTIREIAFKRWDKAVAEEKIKPWVHRLEFEKEFGEPGKSQGMTTRSCVRLQELEFDVEDVARMVLTSGRAQCSASRQMNWDVAKRPYDRVRVNIKRSS